MKECHGIRHSVLHSPAAFIASSDDLGPSCHKIWSGFEPDDDREKVAAEAKLQSSVSRWSLPQPTLSILVDRGSSRWILDNATSGQGRIAFASSDWSAAFW